MTDAVARASHIADEILFPAAIETDAAERVPESHLRALADAGLFGLRGPRAAGGLELRQEEFSPVVESLAGGCLATTFVWLQHHGAVQALAQSGNTALAAAWLPELCAGRRRAGLALQALRPGPALLEAVPAPGGYRLEGNVPWVTGWGMIHTLFTVARSAGQQTVSLLIDAAESRSLSATLQRLVATNASRSVVLRFRQHFVPHEQVVSVEEYEPMPAYDGGGRSNGSLALGVCQRACRLIGETPLWAELDERRRALDGADEHAMAAARARAVELALRASAAAITHAGSRSITAGSHAQRLGREALFLLVFGSRPAIQSALLAELRAVP
jgi:alkylation response protein AidB-like acyl-CoA dehydrogenase